MARKEKMQFNVLLLINGGMVPDAFIVYTSSSSISAVWNTRSDTITRDKVTKYADLEFESEGMKAQKSFYEHRAWRAGLTIVELLKSANNGKTIERERERGCAHAAAWTEHANPYAITWTQNVINIKQPFLLHSTSKRTKRKFGKNAKRRGNLLDNFFAAAILNNTCIDGYMQSNQTMKVLKTPKQRTNETNER